MARKINVADKLGVNNYHTDETHSHITVNKENGNLQEIDQVVRVCPAALYSVDPSGEVFFEHLGCLECGTCKALSEDKVVKEWHYPEGSKGIQYRFG